MVINIQEIQSALEMAGGSVGLTALFLAGIMSLWYGKHGENVQLQVGALFWYALLSLIVLINPLYINIIQKYLPEMYEHNTFLWIIPTVPVVLYTGARAVLQLENLNKKIIFGISFIGILILAASTSYTKSTLKLADKTYIENEKKDILNFVSKYIDKNPGEKCLIWGENDVMEYSRIYDGRIYTLYGKNIWENNITMDNARLYGIDQESIRLYEMMQNCVDNLQEIFLEADDKECDFIILAEDRFAQAGVEAPEVIGNYYMEYTDNTYLLYRYVDY